MKLLLTSGGLTTPEITSSFEELCSKKLSEISVGIISEGHIVEKKDKRWSIQEMHQFINLVGGEMDILDLFVLKKEQLEARMLKLDAVYVLGGHTDFVMHSFNINGFSQLLPEFLKTKVCVGSSAGSMVLCRRISTEAYEEIYGEEGTYGVTRYMNLVDIAIKPHLDSPEVPKVRKENLRKVSETFDGNLYALKDNQAIIVKDGSITTIGGEVLILNKGFVV